MRSTQELCILGVMSGTSLDGIDLAIVRFLKNKPVDHKLIHSKTIPYPKQWLDRLSKVDRLSPTDSSALDAEYTLFLGETITDYLCQHADQHIDFISSHGHTIMHQPERGVTHQIGNLPALASITQRPVVCDFRKADVALGGQGAPLVPGGERDLFSSYAACVNLGGFANITLLDRDQPIAFDICAVNTVLNALAKQLDRDFDVNGLIAKSGQLLPDLQNALDQLPFYKKHPPKSLGVEWIDEFLAPILSSVKEEKIADVMHTYCVHIAKQIGQCLPLKGNILFSGGGCYHRFLMDQISAHSTASIVLPPKAIIEYKEAIVFAYLGLLRWENKPNCLASVTGAKNDHSSGNIFFPQ